VFLESVLLELRSQCVGRALKKARQALDIHRGTGRLWAVLIQLEQSQGVHRQLRVFQQALLEVPKSGEVRAKPAFLLGHVGEMGSSHLGKMGEMGSPHMGKKRGVGILFGFWIFFGVFEAFLLDT